MIKQIFSSHTATTAKQEYIIFFRLFIFKIHHNNKSISEVRAKSEQSQNEIRPKFPYEIDRP